MSGHHCHGEACDHDHSNDIVPTQQASLLEYINHPLITTLNESAPNSGRDILQKPWADRHTPQPILKSSSEDDPELLITIPFTGIVRLHSILLVSPPGASCRPRTLHLYINRDDLDFSSVSDLKPTQTLIVPSENGEGSDGVTEIPVRRSLFNSVRVLTIYVADNYGHEEEDDEEVQTEMSYLGLKGDWMKAGGAPQNLVYEAAANPADHPNAVPGREFAGGMGLGGGK